jgi:steroid delta-isomerase-like uncharacterized protein
MWEESTMSMEENKAQDRRMWEEAFNQGKLAVADEVCAATFTDHDPHSTVRGPERAKQDIALYLRASPDIHFTIEDQIAEGDKVVTRLTVRGTHQGELMGLAATGRQFAVSGISIVRFAHGKVEEQWANFDMLGLLQQLGAVPTPGQAGS